MFQQQNQDRQPKKKLGGPQKSDVVGRKTEPNKTKLAQTVGTRLVDKCTKFGNIRITGRGAKHVLAWMLRVCTVITKKLMDKKICE